VGSPYGIGDSSCARRLGATREGEDDAATGNTLAGEAAGPRSAAGLRGRQGCRCRHGLLRALAPSRREENAWYKRTDARADQLGGQGESSRMESATIRTPADGGRKDSFSTARPSGKRGSRERW